MKTFSRNAILSFSRTFPSASSLFHRLWSVEFLMIFQWERSVAWRSGGVASVRWRAQKGLEDSRKINGTFPRGGKSSSRRAENIYWKTSEHSSKLMTFPFSYSFTFSSSSHLLRNTIFSYTTRSDDNRMNSKTYSSSSRVKSAEEDGKFIGIIYAQKSYHKNHYPQLDSPCSCCWLKWRSIVFVFKLLWIELVNWWETNW